MESVNVHLFAGLSASVGRRSLRAFATEKARSLFAYLAMNGGTPLYRDRLCGLLWGDRTDPEARKALRTTLWRVRSVVEPDDTDRGRILRVEGDTVAFVRGESAWVDVWEFESALEQIDRIPSLEDPRALPCLRRAVDLYRGDLLEGMYDDWCVEPRQRLRLAYIALLERLMRAHEVRGDWSQAIRVGRQVLREDPLREHVHRALISFHAHRGDRPSAILQYRECVRVLDEELGVEPMRATRMLHEEIRLGDAGSGAGLPDLRIGDLSSLLGAVDEAVGDLQALLTRLEEARRSLGDEGGTNVEGRPRAG